MACSLTAPSYYLNQCWLIISKVHWHLSEGNFTIDPSAMNHLNQPENYLSKIPLKSPRGQWVKISPWLKQHFFLSCVFRWFIMASSSRPIRVLCTSYYKDFSTERKLMEDEVSLAALSLKCRAGAFFFFWLKLKAALVTSLRIKRRPEALGHQKLSRACKFSFQASKFFFFFMFKNF